ncbi:hypothetical protein CJU89_4187 [Yarrowia sp. B02]|nr:hypothetical protein CJU89_4187 [Yarrowia sp. B02]
MALLVNLFAVLVSLIVGTTIYLDRSFSELTSRVSWNDRHVYKKAAEYNAASCTLDTTIKESCEDSIVDESTGLVYFSCGETENRTKWFPGCNWWDKEGMSTNSFYVYDPETRAFEKMNLDYHGEFVSHGLSLLKDPANPDTRYIFSINHKSTGSVISVFSLQAGSHVVTYVGDISDSRMYTPNSATPYVEDDGTISIMYTNDHLFRKGFMRHVEDSYGPFLWGHVGNCNFKINGGIKDLSCSRVAVENSYPNGITHIPDTKQFLVADTRLGTLSAFKWDFTAKSLDIQHSTLFGAALDNVHVIPGTKDVVVAGFPDDTEVFYKFRNMDDNSLKIESLAFRANHRENYTIPHVLQKTDVSLRTAF